MKEEMNQQQQRISGGILDKVTQKIGIVEKEIDYLKQNFENEMLELNKKEEESKKLAEIEIKDVQGKIAEQILAL